MNSITRPSRQPDMEFLSANHVGALEGLSTKHAASLIIRLRRQRRGSLMLKEGGRNKAITEAITRFRHGRCPSCGKGIGEPRGMEFRPRSEDLYCHSCRKTWPTVLDIKSLEEQLVVPNETLEELPRSCPMFLVPIQRPMPLIGHRLRNVFRRVVRKSK